MVFGADYYPEHWPKERWAVDAKLMREAGINAVRLAEFSWVLLEPKESECDFSWLDEAIEVLSREGIRVILGTPTAAPPKWLVDKYPDILQKDIYGRQRGFGTRRHYCCNSPVYRDLTEKIVSKMAEHYAGNPNIIAWQIDNEFGCHSSTRCYCENCLKSFHEWLKEKHGSIGALNKAWGTVFWSQVYDSWDSVILPVYAECQGDGAGNNDHNPGLLLDFNRFSSDSVVGYQHLQIENIRRYSSLPITHNMMGGFNEINYYDLGRELDFISWDNYPTFQWGNTPWQVESMVHDTMRGFKNRNYWVMEQLSGPCGWSYMGNTPKPGQLRLWTWQGIAHGAEAIVYFRWRACHFGTEEYWYGILDHDGIPRRRYAEIKRTGEELHRLSDWIIGSKSITETAIVRSFENVWSHGIQKHTRNFDYDRLISSFYNALSANQINCDILSVESDLSKFKLLLMPAFNLMNEVVERKVSDYVRNGGTLVITFRSGTRNDDNSMTDRTLPGYFRELAGAEVYEFDCIADGRKTAVSSGIGTGTASMWCEILKPDTAEVFAAYGSEYYAGEPAITVNKYGRGKVWYIGCDLDQPFLNLLAGHIASGAGVTHAFGNLPDGVECTEKESEGKRHYILLNHNASESRISLDKEYLNLLTCRQEKEELILEAYGLAVLAPV